MKDDTISRDALRQHVREYRTENGVEYAVPLAVINQVEGIAMSRKVKDRRLESPCDLCEFDPPSSFDGKPCCMCPASSKIKQKEER